MRERRQARTLVTGFWPVLLLSILVLLGSMVLSCAVGAVSLSLPELFLAWRGEAEATSVAIVQQRVNRTLLGLWVGAALGVAGVLMQAMTRNPLADPGILGVNAGAGFAVTVGVAFWGLTGIESYIWCSFLGSLLATGVVCLFAGGSRAVSPARLVLVGLALGSALIGASRTLSLLSPSTFDAMRFWGAGTLADRPESTLATIAPFILGGCLLALCLGRSLDMLALGQDLARSSGVNMTWVLLACVLAVTLLSAGATAAAGPIAFVGLLVPQLARALVGASSQSKVLILSLILAPTVVLVADILGRVLVAPRELQVGVLASAVGAPALIFLMRSRQSGKGV
ncbi:FecCD family ABC transporter permease [Rothia nasimurium]|uniref:FecCD family ABC transporter permease n=1 Tax=Rothia nasimurium TaxID=85336 RepID=UPI003612CB0C